MDNTNVNHLTYVGDSIIGSNCNIAAGTNIANLRFDNGNIRIKVKGDKIDSGRRKMGVVFGDGSVDGRGFLSGTSIIEVTSTNPINIFLFLENIAQWDFETQSPENYFYAIPIN